MTSTKSPTGTIATAAIGRRQFHRLAAGVAAGATAGALGAGAAQAATYPTRPVRMIVPFTPGGGVDLIGRVVAKKLVDIMGQNVIVENHGGGNTIIGTSLVAQAKPDGYTVLMASNTYALNPTLRPTSLPYDTLKDFTPVAVVVTYPFVLTINPSVKARSVKELIALAKANPGKLNFCSAGIGTGNHLAMELFRIKAGIELTHVPYQGSGDYMPDLLSDRVQMVMSPVGLVTSYFKTGQLIALGVGEPERIPALPDVPTISEAGVPGYLADEWNGYAVRTGTPPAIIATLNADINKAIQDPGVVAAFTAAGANAKQTTPQQAKDFITTEISKWHDVITTIGITVK